ncbi:MAG: hypothetical protein K1X92_10635 [Bacteroidia bacterium]|nr:hypothetical protein [Bacteroidia bacterium]
MYKYFFTLILLACGQSAFSQTEATAEEALSPNQQAARQTLTEGVKTKQNEGWIVEKVETTLYAPEATNELQESINKEETTILPKEEFEKRFHESGGNSTSSPK